MSAAIGNVEGGGLAASPFFAFGRYELNASMA